MSAVVFLDIDGVLNDDAWLDGIERDSGGLTDDDAERAIKVLEVKP